MNRIVFLLGIMILTAAGTAQGTNYPATETNAPACKCQCHADGKCPETCPACQCPTCKCQCCAACQGQAACQPPACACQCHGTCGETLRNPSLITADSLKNATLVELEENGRHYTPEEVATLINYLKNGGSVIVAIDEESRTPLLSDGVSLITKPFGLTLTADVKYLHNCGGIAKTGVINKQDREIPYSGGRAVTGGTPFAWQLDKDGNPAEPFAAYVETNNGGKLVVLAEKMAWLGLGVPEGVRLTGVPNDASKTTYWGKDSKIFMDEIRCWLVCKVKAGK